MPIKKYLSTLKCAALDYAKRDLCYPFYCTFKVIQRCDSRCGFCYVWRKQMPDMPTENALGFMHNVVESSVVPLRIEGGRPPLRKNVGDVFCYIHAKPIYIPFMTS